MSVVTEELEQLIAAIIVDELFDFPASSRQRIDDISIEQSRRLSLIVEDQLKNTPEPIDECFYILCKNPESSREISYEKAVELRNHVDTKLLLFVPTGSSASQSSLDNTFMKKSLSEYIAEVGERLIKEFVEIETLGSSILDLKRTIKPSRNSQEWVEFLVSLQPKFGATIGENLWRIGLIPDLGIDARLRFESNLNATKSISRPIAPSSSLDARLAKAGLPDSEIKNSLLSALGNQYLSDSTNWSKYLLDNFRNELTFEKWPISESSPHSLNSILFSNFIASDGTPTKASRLNLLDDGVLMAPMSKNKTDELVGRVGLNWKTSPAKTDSVAKWKIELVVPNSIRELVETDFTVSEILVSGTKRSHVFDITLGEDNLRLGKRFSFLITALDKDGHVINFESGLPSSDGLVTKVLSATAESQEFVVEEHDIDTSTPARREDFSSISEARLSSIVNGAPLNGTEEISWDNDGQVLIYRYDTKSVSHIRTNEIVLELQKMMLENLESSFSFYAHNEDNLSLSFENIEVSELIVPRSVAAARKKFLSLLKKQGIRGRLESVNWGDDIKQAASSYLNSYRKSLEAADQADLPSLLAMDTLTLKINWGQSVSQVVVTLPTHPLRIAWSSKFDEMLNSWSLTKISKGKTLKQLIDTKLVSRITPANLPFISMDKNQNPLVYQGELTQGTCLHIPAELAESEALIAATHNFLGFSREGLSQNSSAQKISDKIHDYKKLHESSKSISFITINPGDGAVLADAIRKSLPETLNLEKPLATPYPIQIQAFGNNTSFTNPVSALQKLQNEYKYVSYEVAPSHLVPPFSLSSRPITHFEHEEVSADIGIIQNLASTKVSLSDISQTRSPYVSGLVIPTVSIQTSADEKKQIKLVPSLDISKNKEDAEITAAHRAHQRAIARVMDAENNGIPSISIDVNEEQITLLDDLHKTSDWVLSLDRNAGLAIYEDVLKPKIQGTFLIDYAPDFIDGVGDRLTVTSTNRVEVERILRTAMEDLNLRGLNLQPSEVLETLASVSGKLTMRLLEPNTLAREAVGLAALVSHLDLGKKLEDTIIIPVDAHPEIFHPATRGPGENGLRCDLILARVTSKSFKLELVEVKARASAATVDAELNKHIADQLVETRRLLLSTVFASSTDRPDSQLQWARALSLLHFYADRSIRNNHFSESSASQIHHLINKLEENPQKPEISMAGYVVSMDEGDAPKPIERDNVRIKYLRAADVKQLGKTTHNFHTAPIE